MKLIRLATALFLVMVGPGGTIQAFSQAYPSKPVRVIVPFTAGTGIDIVCRSVSQKLSDRWGQPVVVDNRPGAGGTVGSGIVARSAADGYTLLVHSNAHAVSPALYAKLPYDAVKDFVAIAPLARLAQVLVVAPSAGIKSVPGLIAAAKASPGKLTFASLGMGSGTYFSAEKFRLATGIDVVHVPYKGGPEAMTEVMTGRVTYWLPSLGAALPLIQGGKLTPLGVSTSERSPWLPDVPTIAEVGVSGFEESLWFGMWAPAGTPSPIVNRIAKDISPALAAPDLRERFRALAAEPMSMTPVEFARFVRSETDTVARVAKVAGIKPQ